MDGISSDLLVRILTYLSGRDTARCMLINKKFHALLGDTFLWSELCRQERQGAVLPEVTEETAMVGKTVEEDKGPHCSRIRMQLRQYEALGRLRYVQWRRMQCSRRLERMEAHTLNAIFDGRFAAVVGGWSEMGDNRVDVFDCRSLVVEGGTAVPAGSTLQLLDVVTENAPRFRYGFSTVEHEGELLVYGGMRSGGYTRECSDLYRIGLHFHLSSAQAATSPAAVLHSHFVSPVGESVRWDRDWGAIKGMECAQLLRVTAAYSADLSVPATPLPAAMGSQHHHQQHHPHARGYHTAVVVRLDGRPTMLVWGGLHQRGPTTELELLDLPSLVWRKGDATGQEPSPRFGHSCVSVPCVPCPGTSVGTSTDRLIFTGGSDGSDLVRNGRELREIHVLHLARASAANGSDMLVWSTLKMDAVAPSLRASVAVPGRCHCAVGLGMKVLLFGGGAVHSNRVHVIEIPRKEAVTEEILFGTNAASSADQPRPSGGYTVRMPEVAGDPGAAHVPPAAQTRHRGKPLERCSAAAALVMGRFWLVLGGFSVKYSQMNDLWVLDLAHGASDAWRLAAGGSGSAECGGGDAADGAEDGENEDEDEGSSGEEEWWEESDGSEEGEEDGEEEGIDGDGAAWMAGASTGAAMLWAQQLLAGWGGPPAAVGPLAQHLAAMLQAGGLEVPAEDAAADVQHAGSDSEPEA